MTKNEQNMDNIQGQTTVPSTKYQAQSNHKLQTKLYWLLLLVSLTLIAHHGHKALNSPQKANFIDQRLSVNSSHTQPQTPFIYSEALSPAHEASVHAATITQHSDADGKTKTLAAWYGGTREGAQDVRLFLAEHSTEHSNWTPAQPVISRLDAGYSLNRYIKKLGNPLLFSTRDGRVWLFFVTVSIGGWAGSAINVMVSEDGGKSFGPPQRITTSPFLNISTLVRNRPIELANGGLLLPIYHEFIGKFCELLWLDPQGKVIDKQRLTWGRHTLQPAIATKGSSELAVFMRVSKPKTFIEVMSSKDGGKNFTKPTALELPNDNAAIEALSTTQGDWLLIYNHDTQGRDKLSIATASTPEGPWRQQVILDQYAPQRPYSRFSYPAIVADRSVPDQYHLLYTVERQFIQYHRFNTSWLNQ